MTHKQEEIIRKALEYRVRAKANISLAKLDPDDTSAFEGDKEEAEKHFLAFNNQIEALQELLYAEGKHKLLIVLQAMDTGGKDGVIRQVFDGVNPQGVRVVSFKRPTEPEMKHDFLWRIHQQLPARGEMVIFNRSHYEDVLVVRVHDLVPKRIWKQRFDHIKNFESMLADEGMTIIKFFLHISEEEQKARLESRLEEKEKHWKFEMGDLEERKLWPDYMKAYNDAILRTTSKAAPWYVVPANRKWYRNLVIAAIVAETLRKLDMHFPAAAPGLEKVKVE